MLKTPNLNLNKPEGTDVVNIDDLNYNADVLDVEVPKKLDKSGGTMTGILTAQSNTGYTTRQVRNIIISADAANASLMQNGDIWIQYK